MGSGHRRPSTFRTLLLAAALALASVLTAAPPAAAAPAPTTAAAPTAGPTAAGATTGFRFFDLRARDGVVLKANVIAPTTGGRHPAVVLVNSWGLNDLEYLAQARALAGRGYVVLSYTTRGFWGSGGSIDTAGPLDVADVSAAIDWLLAHTSADPGRIGAGGVSYGAGISLVAAGHDPRLKAVVALSGWTDLVASLYDDYTRRPQAVFFLEALGRLTGRPSAELNRILADYHANRDVERMIAFGRTRSASSYVDAINANGTAVLMANAYGDSLFGPNQLVDFYGRLTGPKRLELAPGDHAVVEATGLLGLPNHVWASVTAWLDRYVAGTASGIGSGVVLRTRGPGPTVVEQHPAWPAPRIGRLGLGAVQWWDGTGPLRGAPATGWSRTIGTGLDTTAGAGVILLSNGLEGLTGIAPTVWFPSISRLHAGVWVGDALRTRTQIRGIPRLHLSFTPSAANGTVVAYLYDLDALGTGSLIGHAPASWLGAAPGRPTTLDVPLPAAGYDVPAGHRIALVVDTADPLYRGYNSGGTVTFTGGSWLDL
jgi:dienelactone hydrolase